MLRNINIFFFVSFNLFPCLNFFSLSLPQFVSQLGNFINLFGCNFTPVFFFFYPIHFYLDKYFYVLSFFNPLFFISDESASGFLFFYKLTILNKSICIYMYLIQFRLLMMSLCRCNIRIIFFNMLRSCLRSFIPNKSAFEAR